RIIVVDNGSAPEHLQRLKACLPSGVEVIESPVNLGFAGGNNLGIRRAVEQGAAYILLLNNDATVRSDAIQNMVSTAGRLPRLGVLGGKILIAGKDGPTGEIWAAGGRWSPLKAQAYNEGLAEKDRGQYDHAAEEEFIPACLWLVPVQVFRDVGLL